MIITKNHTVYISIGDIQKNFRQFKGKRIKFSAIIKRVSVRLGFILAETDKGNVKIKNPNECLELLNRLNNIIDGDGKIKVRVIVEGEPYFCAYSHSVGIKKGKVLEIYDTRTKK